jgi:hypothetical protein
MAEPATTLFVDQDVAIITWRNIYAVVWRNETTMTASEMVHRRCEEFAKRFPEGVGMLTVVTANAPMPPADSRERLARFMREGTYVKASGVAFEGTGFRAAAIRSVVTGLTMLARQPFPHKIFATLEEASGWLAIQLREKGVGRCVGVELSDAITTARELFPGSSHDDEGRAP